MAVVVSALAIIGNRRDVRNSAPVLIKFMENVDWKVHLDVFSRKELWMPQEIYATRNLMKDLEH